MAHYLYNFQREKQILKGKLIIIDLRNAPSGQTLCNQKELIIIYLACIFASPKIMTNKSIKMVAYLWHAYPPFPFDCYKAVVPKGTSF